MSLKAVDERRLIFIVLRFRVKSNVLTFLYETFKFGLILSRNEPEKVVYEKKDSH